MKSDVVLETHQGDADYTHINMAMYTYNMLYTDYRQLSIFLQLFSHF